MKKHLLSFLTLIFITSFCHAQNPSLWGMTSSGGVTDGDGIIFNYNISTEKETKVHDFGVLVDGKEPLGSLLQLNDSMFYGTTNNGGIYDEGTLFSYNILSGKETDIYDLGYYTGTAAHPFGSLIVVNDSLLYGMTTEGGLYFGGTIFNYNLHTGKEVTQHSFGATTDGAIPYSSLIQGSDSLLYGLTSSGGVNDSGIIFSFNINTLKEKDLHDFGSGTDGKYPYGSLIQANGGLLYGVTWSGGVNDSGMIFSYDIKTDVETDLYDFSGGHDGSRLISSLMAATDSLLFGTTTIGGVNALGTLFSYNIFTGQETKLYDFGRGIDGANPCGAVIKANDGLLYGTTENGGSKDSGTVFSYNIKTNIETDRYDFNGQGYSSFPFASLIQANNGLLYGLTPSAVFEDVYNTILRNGTLFSFNITTNSEANLYEFGYNTDGKGPTGSLIRASDGLLYGMTPAGGATAGGIIFSYNIFTGKETILPPLMGQKAYSGGSSSSLIQATNGLLYGISGGGIVSYNISMGAETLLNNCNGTDVAPDGSLLQVNDSMLYGLGTNGGANIGGTLFSYNINTNIVKDIYDFSSVSGFYPYGSLIKASNGLLYGMTESGNSFGSLFSYNIDSAKLNVLYKFEGPPGGQYPFGSLVQADNGLIYGMTKYGGTAPSTWGNGLLFSYNISTNSVTNLHSFGIGTDGTYPMGTPIQASNGLLYGTTQTSGPDVYANGTIFSYDISTGAENILHNFLEPDGEEPEGDLLEVDTSTVFVKSSGAVICPGSSVTLMAGGAASYTWSPSTGLSASTGSMITASPTVTTTYTVVGTLNGNTYTTNVTVVILPGITVNKSTTICNGVSAPLIATGGGNFTWSPATGLNATTGDSVIASPAVTTIYSVTGINMAGCISTAMDTVTVETCTGIPQLSVNNNQLSIYPNPTTGEVNIFSEKNIDEVIVSNLLGQMVLKSPASPTPMKSEGDLGVTQFTFKLKDDGMYFITVNANNQVSTSKLIVSK